MQLLYDQAMSDLSQQRLHPARPYKFLPARSRSETRMEMDDTPCLSLRFIVNRVAHEHINTDLELCEQRKLDTSMRNLATSLSRLATVPLVSFPVLTPVGSSGSGARAVQIKTPTDRNLSRITETVIIEAVPSSWSKHPNRASVVQEERTRFSQATSYQ